jgi:distribution and morphology protein 12
LTHTSDLTLTLLTSLTVHYPASVFMSLPLKLSITGLQLAADIILAFDGEKNRVHLTILDEGDEEGVPVGMRLLPEMRIDSEIGHSDAHVLRNVGKIERFIADVVRKTLVDELVFPNFHTIAL